MLDIGCGWGALAIHAARNHGVEVLGVTLSAPQVEIATQRAKDEGVAGQVDFRLLDYRNVSGTFDAVSSVGMFEHVGKSRLAEYFSHVFELLDANGSFLNHGIVTRNRAKFKSTPTFINIYVFSDGELERLDQVVREVNRAGFDLRDVESLPSSYALTSHLWVSRPSDSRCISCCSTSPGVLGRGAGLT